MYILNNVLLKSTVEIIKYFVVASKWKYNIPNLLDASAVGLKGKFIVVNRLKKNLKSKTKLYFFRN